MGFFATFWSWLNGQLAAYIGDNTARLASALEPAVLTFATIYVMAWGYLHLMGKITEPLEAGLKRIALIALILGVGLRLWLYNTVIVDTFYNAPAQLAAAVVGASDPVRTIDGIWDSGGAVAGSLWDRGGGAVGLISGGFGFYLAGAVVWCLIGVLCVYAMFLIALSSIALAVLLGGAAGVGPAFYRAAIFRCDAPVLFRMARAAGQLRAHHRPHRDGGRAPAPHRSILCRADGSQRQRHFDGRRPQHDVDRAPRVSRPTPSHAHCLRIGRWRLAQFVRHCKPKCFLGRGKNRVCAQIRHPVYGACLKRRRPLTRTGGACCCWPKGHRHPSAGEQLA
jgi:hypothetical protein